MTYSTVLHLYYHVLLHFYSANYCSTQQHIYLFFYSDFEMAKHHPDLIFCRKQAGKFKKRKLVSHLGNFRCCYWPTLWQMWRTMCNLWLICSPINFSSNLWRVQLWILSGKNIEFDAHIFRLATRFLTLHGDLFNVLSSPWTSENEWTKFGEFIRFSMKKRILNSKSPQSPAFSCNYEKSKILAQEKSEKK